MYVEKLSSSGDKEIWEYSYDDKNVNLYSEKKYILKENRQKELYYSKTTEGNKTTAVYLENGDTVTFDEQYFDKNGNVIQNTFRDHFVEEINKKSLFKYDGNNCMMEIISEDYIKGKTVKKTFLYEMKQDTLIKKMYEDGQLFGMAQTVILNDSHKIEFSYSAENELIKKKESKNPDDKTRIEIETSFKKENSIFGSEIIFTGTDTVIYVNGKEIKEIQNRSEGQIVTTKEYDIQGNITK
jgi:hypothetical protein